MVIFTDHTINGKILNAYNNNVVRFRVDTPKPISHATVRITYLSVPYIFKITPSPSGEFYFNFKSVTSKLINAARFQDWKDYNPNGSLYHDPHAHFEAEVDYKVYFADGTTQSHKRWYDFIKGVHQVMEKIEYQNRGVSFPLLKGQSPIVTVFDGYPNDIALFGKDISMVINPTDGVVFLAHNLATPIGTGGKPISFTNDKGVQRLTLCDGQTVWDELDGYNVILFNGYNIRVRVVNRCGVYLKWHNQYGGWDYYIFNKETLSQRSDGSLGEIANDFSNLWDTNAPDYSRGKAVKDVTMLKATGIYWDELERVRGVFASPKVYLYTGERYDANDLDKWTPVMVSGKSIQWPDRGINGAVTIEMEMPKLYSLSI